METFASMITDMWVTAPFSVCLQGWRNAFGLEAQTSVLKNLPTCVWDHTQVHWRESQMGQNYRLDKQPAHDLLRRLWNDAKHEHVWRNFFHINEMSWVKRHAFQGQILFPVTGSRRRQGFCCRPPNQAH